MFLDWIFALFGGVYSIVQANGQLSDTFSILRSVREEYPLSSLLCVMTVESLLRNLEAFQGIQRDLE